MARKGRLRELIGSLLRFRMALSIRSNGQCSESSTIVCCRDVHLFDDLLMAE